MKLNEIEKLVCQAVKLHSPSYLKADMESHSLPSLPLNTPTVTLTREKVIEFANAYKVMGELVARILGNANFSMLDILDFQLQEDRRIAALKLCTQRAEELAKAADNYRDSLVNFKVATHSY